MTIPNENSKAFKASIEVAKSLGIDLVKTEKSINLIVRKGVVKALTDKMPDMDGGSVALDSFNDATENVEAVNLAESLMLSLELFSKEIYGNRLFSRRRRLARSLGIKNGKDRQLVGLHTEASARITELMGGKFDSWKRGYVAELSQITKRKPKRKAVKRAKTEKK